MLPRRINVKLFVFLNQRLRAAMDYWRVNAKKQRRCVAMHGQRKKKSTLYVDMHSARGKSQCMCVAMDSQRKYQRLFSFLFCCFGLCFVASDFLTTICNLAIVNVCVIIILSIGNTQISILLLSFLYLFVELMITMNEYNFV